MFTVIATAAALAVLAAWASARVSARRERRLVEARRRRACAAVEFATATGRYAPRSIPSPRASRERVGA